MNLTKLSESTMKVNKYNSKNTTFNIGPKIITTEGVVRLDPKNKHATPMPFRIKLTPITRAFSADIWRASLFQYTGIKRNHLEKALRRYPLIIGGTKVTDHGKKHA